MAKVIVDEFITVFRNEVTGGHRVRADLSKTEKQMVRTQQAVGRGVLYWAVGFSFLASRVAEVETQLVGMATQARISVGEMFKLDDALRKVARSTGVSSKMMREAIEEYVELTGDITTGKNNAKLLSEMMLGGKMSAQDSASLLAAYTDKGVTDPDKLREMVNNATALAKLGSVPIQKMGGLIPRALSLYETTGIGDIKEANAEIVASFQMVNRVVRSPKKTVTAIENMLNDYSDKIKEINQITGSALKGNEGILEVMKVIAKHYKISGDKSLAESVLGQGLDSRQENMLGKLNDVFGRRGIRGALGVAFNLDDMQRIMEEANEMGDVVARDSVTQSKTIQSAFNDLSTVFDGVAKSIADSGGIQMALMTLGGVLMAVGFVIETIPAKLLGVIIVTLMLVKVLAMLKWGLIAIQTVFSNGTALGKWLTIIYAVITAVGFLLGLMGMKSDINATVASTTTPKSTPQGIGGGKMVVNNNTYKVEGVQDPDVVYDMMEKLVNQHNAESGATSKRGDEVLT